MRLTLIAVLATMTLAGCAYRTEVSKNINDAVTELDRSIWEDNLKPIVQPQKAVALPPLK